MPLQHSKFNLVEQSTPMLMLLLSIWFLSADLSNVSAIYYFLKIFPDWLWSIIFAAIGITKGVSIVFGWYLLRRIAALISVFLWYSLAYIFGLGNYHSLLIPICAFFGFQSALSFLRIYEDRKKWNGKLWNGKLMTSLRFYAQKIKWNGKT